MFILRIRFDNTWRHFLNPSNFSSSGTSIVSRILNGKTCSLLHKWRGYSARGVRKVSVSQVHTAVKPLVSHNIHKVCLDLAFPWWQRQPYMRLCLSMAPRLYLIIWCHLLPKRQPMQLKNKHGAFPFLTLTLCWLKSSDSFSLPHIVSGMKCNGQNFSQDV